MKKAIIIGGGLAGLNLAKSLSGSKSLEVTVVDKNNYHFFTPLLYQVSTAFIEPSNISYPFRKLFHGHDNVRFHMGELLSIDPNNNTIETNNGILVYDYLVLATGTVSNFFGNENLRQNALPMKTIDDALRIRNHILLRAEEAIGSPSADERVKLTNIVISGGGPSGVEMAGMLAEMARNIVAVDYPELATEMGDIYLVNSAPTLLGMMTKSAQNEAFETLTKLGVKILLRTFVKDYDGDVIVLGDGATIPAATLIWCSGVIGKRIKGLPSQVYTIHNRIIVDKINRVEGYSNLFAIGDISFQTADAVYPNGHPQIAQVALQQGKLLGENLLRLAANDFPRPFAFHDKGKMAIISKYKAVADLDSGSFKGGVAWLLWLLIHIIPLVNFRNKIKILLNWWLSFVTNDVALRLIFRSEKKASSSAKSEQKKIMTGDSPDTGKRHGLGKQA